MLDSPRVFAAILMILLLSIAVRHAGALRSSAARWCGRPPAGASAVRLARPMRGGA